MVFIGMQIYRGIVLILAFAAAPLTAMANGPFDGHWESHHQDENGLYYGAQLDLEQSGDQVSGTWGEGSTQRVWSGSLKGTAVDHKLNVRFCSDGSFGNEPFVCPNLEPESNLFVVDDGKLTWYRKQDSGVELYEILHREPRRRAMKKVTTP
jgi:hypothetical protein